MMLIVAECKNMVKGERTPSAGSQDKTENSVRKKYEIIPTWFKASHRWLWASCFRVKEVNPSADIPPPISLDKFTKRIPAILFSFLNFTQIHIVGLEFAKVR